MLAIYAATFISVVEYSLKAASLQDMKVLIIGVGNILLSDDGAGVHVVRALRDSTFPDDIEVELIDGGTLSFTLADPIEGAEALVVVDAAQLQAAAGVVQVFEGETMDGFLLRNHISSAHEAGLADLMTIAKLSDRWPRRRALIAIQPQSLGWGERPTPAVAAALAVACARIAGLIEAWHQEVI